MASDFFKVYPIILWNVNTLFNGLCRLYIFFSNKCEYLNTKGSDYMNLSDRCLKFVKTLGVPMTQFCQRIKLSRSAFYRWIDGSLKLSDTTLDRIEKYISQFGF